MRNKPHFGFIEKLKRFLQNVYKLAPDVEKQGRISDNSVLNLSGKKR